MSKYICHIFFPFLSRQNKSVSSLNEKSPKFDTCFWKLVKWICCVFEKWIVCIACLGWQYALIGYLLPLVHSFIHALNLTYIEYSSHGTSLIRPYFDTCQSEICFLFTRQFVPFACDFLLLSKHCLALADLVCQTKLVDQIV